MWNDGYVTSLAYTAGYYPELNPGHMRLALLSAGVKGLASKAPRYLELGFGQGLSLAIHAAANDGEFWGADFNPAHASAAAEMVAASGASASILEHSFAELDARIDLPDFDVIALHGVWSWISSGNRQAIVTLIRRLLRPGGLVYVSYNCWPGHAASAPLQHLLMLHGRYAGREGDGLPGRIDAAIAFADQLSRADALFFRLNPGVKGALDRLRSKDRRYLAHEYFNADWHPLPFAAVSDQLGAAKLSFAASAGLLDHFERLHVNEAGQAILRDIADPDYRESVRDYLTNAQFRRDYFVRGLRRLSPQEQRDGFRALRLVLSAAPEAIDLRLKTALGDLSLNRGTFDPLLDALAGRASRVASWGELEQALAGRMTFQQLRDAVVILAGLGHLHAAHGEDEIERVRERSHRLSGFLLDKALTSGEFTWLPSPVTGKGVRVGRAEQWFLRARQQGREGPSALARAAWAILARTGERLTKDGKPLETEAESVAELEAQAQAFLNKKLADLAALGIRGAEARAR